MGSPCFADCSSSANRHFDVFVSISINYRDAANQETGTLSYSCVAASPMSSLRLATCCSSIIPNLLFVWTCSSLGSGSEAISVFPDCRASVSKEATYASFMYAKLKPSVIEAMCGGKLSGISAAGLLDSFCLQ